MYQLISAVNEEKQNQLSNPETLTMHMHYFQAVKMNK